MVGLTQPAGKYNCLISGEAQDEVEAFLAQKHHTLAEYKDKIQHYRDLSREITGLDDVVWFDMFQLECHDIKHGLNEIVQNLTLMLVKQLAENHMCENARLAEMQGFVLFTVLVMQNLWRIWANL